MGTYALWPRAAGGLRLGPFVGFRVSTDGGLTWRHNDTRTAAGRANLFGEPGCENTTYCPNAPIRFGAPHFVDFGQNMAASPDGRAYLIGHGCLNVSTSRCDWQQGDSVFLARTRGPPAPATINMRESWEFFAGGDAWTSDLLQAQPLFQWAVPDGGHTGIVTMTYDAALGRFLTAVSTGSLTDHKNGSAFDSYVLESPSVTGPFAMAAYLQRFGAQAYFLNFVSKFSQVTALDGHTAMLAYSADYTFGPARPVPSAGRYGLVLQEVSLALAKTK